MLPVRPSALEGPRRIVVGMVAQRLVEALRARDTEGRWGLAELAEVPRAPDDRVALASCCSGRRASDLTLGDDALWADPMVRLVRGDAAVAIDRVNPTATTASGRSWRDDHLVLATGLRAAMPPILGNDLPGVFVSRMLDDVAALRGWVE